MILLPLDLQQLLVLNSQPKLFVELQQQQQFSGRWSRYRRSESEQGDIIPLQSEGAAAGITSARDALARTQEKPPLFDPLPIKVLALTAERTEGGRKD